MNGNNTETLPQLLKQYGDGVKIDRIKRVVVKRSTNVVDEDKLTTNMFPEPKDVRRKV